LHPEINSILIGVDDLARSKKFYADGLGCPIESDYPQFVSFKLGNGSPTFGLYPRAALAADAGVSPEGSGFGGVTMHYLVKSSEQVDAVMDRARGAGAKIVKPAQKLQWGYSGWFSDPDGFLWKVAAGQ
jgi:catechol 2,3-dioxygenase-like lactoylglutathione lyase family enzyme